MSQLTHLSLFSGVGGLDLAAEWAGFQTVGQCEWADYPYKVLCKHWPDVPKWRDIRTLTGESFYERTGLRTVDIISGGFPCQPFSCAGQRRGKDDDRYLWPEMLGVIREQQPAWVIAENVAGILSMAEPMPPVRVENKTIHRTPEYDSYEAVLTQQERMLIADVVKDLESIGHRTNIYVLPACGVGAPHQRYRVFIVANAYGQRCGKRWERGGMDAVQRGWQNESVSLAEPGTYVENTGSIRREQQRVLPQQPRGTKFIGAGEGGADRPAAGVPADVADVDNTRFQIPGHEPGIETIFAENGTEYNRDVCNAMRGGCTGNERRGQWPEFANGCRRPVEPGLGGIIDGPPGWLDADRLNFWNGDWEAGIPRIAHGMPNRVDRLRGLGNMVVPQQAYPIFAAIAAIEKTKEAHT